MPIKPLSRRAVLRGAGGYFIALPFLECMLPSLANAQSASIKRFVTCFGGSICGPRNVSSLGAYGALPNALPASWAALGAVRNYVSVISNLNIPIYQTSAPTEPASAYNQQHGTTPAPMLAGVTTKTSSPIMVCGQTADQFVAQAIAGSTRFNSLQMRVQALPYSGSSNNLKGIMSAKMTNGSLSALAPMVSPQQIYQMLFSSFTGGTTTGGSTTGGTTSGGTTTGGSTTGGAVPPSPIDRKKSVMDLVLDDSKRLTSKVSGADKIRLDQHFDEIRSIENSLMGSSGALSIASSGGGSLSTSSVPSGSMCTKPANPGADPALGANAFVGWSNETLRGQVMADMIAYAMACDMTRVVSWMLSFDQVFMKNQLDGVTDMHDDSHKAQTQFAQLGANANWHCALFAQLVQNLANLSESGVPLIDNTFLSLFFAESQNAHGRTNMHQVIGGRGSFLKLGQHIDGGGQHPGKIQIAGMQAVGMNTNTLNELTGPLGPILR